ncbi:MAG: tRNA pseudouridine(38-40) synthase TruA [Acidobacteriota bacterium]
MHFWKLTIEYDGTRYSGWQEQKQARTVAGEIRSAASKYFHKPVELTGAGRTDAGVHALGQVAKLGSTVQADPAALMRGINDQLPADINILKVEMAARDFNPRKDARARYYLYQISTRRTAFAKKYVWWVRDRLSVERMSEAARAIAGSHDFAAFAEKRMDDRSTIVSIESAAIHTDGDLILFRIRATHFLWKMVRRIVGSLVEVGRGNLDAEDFCALMESGSPSQKDFSVAAHTAPPSGLFLERVIYDEKDMPDLAGAAFQVKKR